MNRKALILFYCLASNILYLTSACAQPRAYHAGEILLMLKKLNTLGSVLYIAAHPDDENTRLITYLAQKENLDVAYLSLTRGEGGQNLIGTEQGDLLGLIRTQELLAARRIDGGEQYFTRAKDFGYSKTHAETLEKWNEQEVLEDMVYVIRKFKPDVIITRFPPLKYNYDTHGHHSASAYLAEKAFDMAADATMFPEQLEFVETWQAKRLYWNTSTWFYQNTGIKLDTTGKIMIDIGAYIPELGESVTEIAARSRSMHKSQGFGAAENRGSEIEYLEFVKGVQAKKNLFEDINKTWGRVKESEKVSQLLKRGYDEFDARDKTKILPHLLEAYQLLKDRKDFWSKNKIEGLKTVIYAVCGLFLESTASDYSAAVASNVKIKIAALNRSSAMVKLLSVEYSTGLKQPIDTGLLEFNQLQTFEQELHIHKNHTFTTPHWLTRPKPPDGNYPLGKLNHRIAPESIPAVEVCYFISINDEKLKYCEPLVYKWTDRVKGELYRPFIISPDVTIQPNEPLVVFSDDTPQKLSYLLKSWAYHVESKIVFHSQNGWVIQSDSDTMSLPKKNDEMTLSISLTPQTDDSTFDLKADFISRYHNRSFIEISYDHIPYQTVFLPSITKVVKLGFKKSATNLAYITGAGDEVANGLQQAGYNVTQLTNDNFSETNLSQFDAIIIGIRAYNTEAWLPHQKQKLMEYVKNGGNVIVQYQTTGGLLTNDFGPYPFKIGRGRVTVEEAPMTMLDPKHPVFNFPNKLTEKDFEGWMQERGLYFASEWDSNYVPLFSCADPNEEPLKGSLILANYGKGAFMYTGISFFRQLPAGVPGVYRLLANMIAYRKEGNR